MSEAVDLTKRIIFDQRDLIVVDKPAGWLTVPSRFEKEDPRFVLGRQLEKLTNSRLFPIHRLDQEVSGLVLFARSSDGQRRVSRWFENRIVKKTYQALSGARDFSHWPADLERRDGDIEVGTDLEWKCKIMRGKRRAYEHSKGDPSLTEAKLLGPGADGHLHWLLQPHTGRPHQLRFEMSRHGFPIVGDALYGSKEKWSDGIALRAVRLDFSSVYENERVGLPEALSVEGFFE